MQSEYTQYVNQCFARNELGGSFCRKDFNLLGISGELGGGGEGALGRKSKENHFRNGGKTLRAAVETKTSQTQNTRTQENNEISPTMISNVYFTFHLNPSLTSSLLIQHQVEVRKIENSWDNVADWLPGNLF